MYICVGRYRSYICVRMYRSCICVLSSQEIEQSCIYVLEAMEGIGFVIVSCSISIGCWNYSNDIVFCALHLI